MNNPPKWKMAIIVWLAIYPLITVIFYIFNNQIQLIHPMLRTLAITVVVVPIMVFILIPTYTKFFKDWLIR